MNRLSLTFYIRKNVSLDDLETVIGTPLDDKPDFYALKADRAFFITGDKLGNTTDERHTIVQSGDVYDFAAVVKVQPLFTVCGYEDFWDLENIVSFVERKGDQLRPFPINQIFYTNLYVNSKFWTFLCPKDNTEHRLSDIFWNIVEKSSPEIYKTHRQLENIPIQKLRLYASFNLEEKI